MAQINAPLLAFNRGIVSERSIARIDVERMRLSATIMSNWAARSQGSMMLRPGTKFLGVTTGSTAIDVQLVDFVGSITDVAFLEFTDGNMRPWVNDAPLARPAVSTAFSSTLASATGYTDASTGGTVTTPAADVIPVMAAQTTGGATITATSFYQSNATYAPWHAADNSLSTIWFCNAVPSGGAPQYLTIDLGAAKTAASWTLRGHPSAPSASPGSFVLQGSTDNFASSVVDLDTHTGVTWAASEQKTFTIGSPNPYRYYRLKTTVNAGYSSGLFGVADIQLLPASSVAPVQFTAQGLVLNATAKGSVAIAKRTTPISVALADQNVEHGFRILVANGPVTFYAGSSDGDDDLIPRTNLGEGEHSLGFTPMGDSIYFAFENDKLINKIVTSIAIEPAGIVDITSPYLGADVLNLRWDQSADVIYLACYGYARRKIERRGVGRSWSIVKYLPDYDALFSQRTNAAVQLKVGATYGNTTLTADRAFFKPGHVGAMFRVFSPHMSRSIPLGAENEYNGEIRVAGISAQSDRTFNYQISGTWVGKVTMQRSYDGEGVGYFDSASSWTANVGPANGTDGNDNVIVHYRFGFNPGDYTSGVAVVTLKHGGTSGYGLVRVTGYVSATQVNVEVVKECFDTKFTDDWQESIYSDLRGHPTDAQLHEGRLCWFGATRMACSVSDDYENFSTDVDGDAGPIIRRLGKGPVNRINVAASLQRLIVGTAQPVISVRSNSLDEPLTPTNTNFKEIASTGAANVKIAKVDQRAVYADRTAFNLYELNFSAETYDYKPDFLNKLCPDLLREHGGVVAMGVQRMPETRIHCVLADGAVCVVTYMPDEQVICFSLYQLGGSGAVKNVCVLPGTPEDAVYYRVVRTLNGVARNCIERIATEDEAIGSGLTWLADCALTGTSASTTITGLNTFEGKQLCVHSQSLGPYLDASGNPRTFTVSGGQITGLPSAPGNYVVGFQYDADWQSTKLAYAAQGGTALTMNKEVTQLGIIAMNLHPQSLRYGQSSAILYSMPQSLDGIAATSAVWAHYDQQAFAFPGAWSTDSRLFLRARSPMPCTLLGAIIKVKTNG